MDRGRSKEGVVRVKTQLAQMWDVAGGDNSLGPTVRCVFPTRVKFLKPFVGLQKPFGWNEKHL